ncbi:MAG: sortase [Patescibacteria group bacterium]
MSEPIYSEPQDVPETSYQQESQSAVNQKLNQPQFAHAKRRSPTWFRFPKVDLGSKNRNLVLGLTISTVLSFLAFIIWLMLTVWPIIWVEAKYQYNTFLQEKLHISNLAQLFIPDFSSINLDGRSKYKDYGIRIPKIFLDEPVVFNVDPNNKEAYTQALKRGIAHASSTSFPDNGGLGYYFAHSSTTEFKTQYNAIFYLLGKLEVGDDIYIWHDGQKNHYQVIEKQVTEPNNVEFLYREQANESIVLQTCWPPGTTKQRMLIFAERVEK